MRASEIRELTDDELERRLGEARQELFNLRFQHATGALENPAALHRAKRDIARLLTLAHERAGLAKHHLAVLWHDYFKSEHFEKFPQLHDLINQTIKAGSGTGARGSLDPATGQALVDGIDEIARIFWETKGKEYVVPQSADQA